MVVKKKKTKTTKSKTTKVVESAPAPAPAAPVAAAAPQEVAPPSLSDAFSDLLGQLASLRTQLTAVTSQTRALAKRSERELRAAQKAGRKRPRKNGARSPSGFVKPTLISKELAQFLGKEIGTEMARTEVTREINGYIRAHKLQDPKNGRRILPDKKLAKLLKLKKDDELTYFNLQRYMSPHFAKSGKKSTGASSSA
tara:strand:+ start:207 stop:797 length:591 start_codon:yes stop_codon:yes gene_type:complete